MRPVSREFSRMISARILAIFKNNWKWERAGNKKARCKKQRALKSATKK